MTMMLSGKKNISVYFFDCPKPIYFITRVVSRLFKIHIEKLIFSITDIRDEQGTSIRLKIAYQEIAKLQQTIQETERYRKLAENINNYSRYSRLKYYLAKSICDYHALGIDADRYVWNAIILLEIFLWFSKKEITSHETYVYLKKRVWWDSIVEHARRGGLVLIPLKPGFKTRYLLKPYHRSYLRHIAIKLLTGSKTRAVTLSGIEGPFLGTEYFGHFNLNIPEYYSDLFFMPQSSLEGSDVKVLFRLREAPLDHEMYSVMRDHRILPIVLDKRASTISNPPIHQFNVKSRLSVHIPGKSWEAKWMAQEISEYDWYYSYWYNIFEKQNVRVFIQWYKYDAEHIAVADAMQSLGGISAMYQRSFEAHPTPETTLALDIEFGFSVNEAELERKNNSNIRYHVATGYPGDYRFMLLRDRADELRRSLEINGANNIVALFDENTADDPRWFCGHEFVKRNYAFWLKKVIKYAWLGLIIKPKKPDNLRQRLGNVSSLLDEALATGRCHIFMHGILQGSLPPALAALAADVAIHDSLSSGTAGLESALTGTPTLLMDFDGWPGNKLYRLGVDRVIFTDWDSAWEACSRYFRKKNLMNDFGNWHELIDELDSFRDGRAAERIGTYLKWLIDGFKAGRDRDSIMAEAAERYCRQWGYDKVSTVP